MSGPRPFQGAGARRRRGAGRADVVEEENGGRDAPPPGNPERSLHVFPPTGARLARLGSAFAVPRQEEGVEGPTHPAGKPHSDEGREVAPPTEIFPRAYGNRNHRRRRSIREQVAPGAGERLPETVRHRSCRERAAGVFRRQDGGTHVPRVREQGPCGVEGGRIRGAGRARREGGGGDGGAGEIPAPGAASSPPRGPPTDRRRGEVRGRGGKEVPETGSFRGNAAEKRRKAEGCQGENGPEGGAGGGCRGPFSGGWRRWSTPGSRGRWRTSSMFRRKGTGRST